MTPDTIKEATKALAKDALTWRDARSNGARLGRVLAAQIRAHTTITEQVNQAASTEIEMTLLQVAASSDEMLAEVADSALRELHGSC